MRRNIVLFLALALMSGIAFASTPIEMQRTAFNANPPQAGVDELDVVVYIEDFEGDVSDWTQVSPDIQPNYWFTDDFMAANGTNAWRCGSYDFGLPEIGGYADDWLQFMVSPVMDLTAATSVSMTFNFSAYIEDGNWDGCNVWVFYGNDPETLTKEIATPTSPAYTETDLVAFDIWFGGMLPAYPGWAGEGGEAFNDAFVAASFDLSAYTGYSNVHVVLAMATDTAYNTGNNTAMYGFIVDDIDVTVDGGTVWADDADGTNVGGPATFETGAFAAGLPILPYQVEIGDAGAWGPAPSPTNVCGVFSDADAAFDHYMEGPEFTLPAVNPGESLWLDVMFNSDIEYTNAFPAEFYWRPEVWNPITNGWVQPATSGNYVYVGGNGSIWEPFSTSGFTYDWDLTYLAGETGVRLRMFFHAPSEDRLMTHHLIDDLLVDQQSLQHDISTVLTMPYPTSVGTDVYGKVTLTNNAPNDETGFMAVWDPGTGGAFPLVPAGPYNLLSLTSMELSIDDPTDPMHVGYWVPAAAGTLFLDAYHTLAGDEIPANDNYPVDVDILAADMWEVGTDSRNFYGSLSVHLGGTGPVVHIDPTIVNGDYFPAGSTYDMAELRLDGFFHSAAGGAPAGCTMDFDVYAGGAVPGALLYTGTYTFTEAPGYLGYTQAIQDVSAEAALQGMTGDFWVGARLTTLAGGGYYQPFAYRTDGNAFDDTQYYDLADAQADAPIGGFGHHVTAVLTNVDQPNALLTLTPTSSTEIPAGGGVLTWDTRIQTFMGQSFNGVDYWETAIMPAGNNYGPWAPVLTFNVTPFYDVTIGRSATVPPGAPAGDYTMVGHAGYYPQVDYIQGSFDFVKLGQAAGSSEWTGGGESFETAGEATNVVIPQAFELGQAYPNPFNPTTAISISLPQVADLNVSVFNVMGQQVAVLASGSYNAGVHTLTFDGSNMASGLYFIQAQVPGQLNELRKVTLLK